MTNIDLAFRPQREALLSGHTNRLNVLLQAQAPDAPESVAVRKPLNLSLVIDRSGSMQGRPLDEAKRCANMIINNLGPTDRASIVVYDNVVDVLVPNRRVDDPLHFIQAIRSIDDGGSTALHSGWLRGAEQAALSQSGEFVSRVLLLSDGQANAGLTDIDQLASQCANVAEEGVTTSTYGLGHHFNEDLMVAMARAGLGQGYYGESAEDLEDPFREEFDLLTSLCARRLRLALHAEDGVQVNIENLYDRDPTGRWKLPDLAYGGEAWALAAILIDGSLEGRTIDNKIRLLTANLEFEDMEGSSQVAGPIFLELPYLPAAAYQAVAEDEVPRGRAAELRAATLQEQARTAAQQGDWDRVTELLQTAREEARDNEWVRASLDALERYAERRETQMFSKEAMYQSRSMRSRLAAKDEGVAFSLREESEKAAFLRRKRERGKRMEGGSERR